MSKVSVIIPTKNRQEYLKKNLNALVNQTVAPDEVIVADNGSTDNTKKIISSFKDKLPIKYLLVKKSGVTHARNNAVKKATHEIVAFLDDDCEAKNNWIEKIKKNQHYLDTHVVQGKSINPNKKNIIAEVMYFCSETGVRVCISESKIINNQIDNKPIFFDFLDTKNLVIGKKIIKKVGTLFDNNLESYNYGEDTELGIRLHSMGISSIYCEDIRVDHHYIDNLMPFIKKSFLAGKTQVAVTKIIKMKHKERYENEKKYAEIFGNKAMKNIVGKRLKNVRIISNEYFRILSKKYSPLRIITFKSLFYGHILFKNLGIYYQKLLYLFIKLPYTHSR